MAGDLDALKRKMKKKKRQEDLNAGDRLVRVSSGYVAF